MTPHRHVTLDRFERALTAGDAAALAATMATDVTLRVAVHGAPFEGRAAAARILGVVLDGALHAIEVVDTIRDGGDTAVMLFSTQVAGHRDRADGALIVRLDDDHRIVDLTVFLRPLAALQALADEMGRRMDGPRPDGIA